MNERLAPADPRDLPYAATSQDTITVDEAAWLLPARRLLAAPELRYRPVLDMLNLFGGTPLAYPNLSNLSHALQTATRAFRNGEDEEYIVMALLHDCADGIAFGTDHGDMAALIMGPFLSGTNRDILRLHVEFQDYYRVWRTAEARNAREAMRGHPSFEPTVRFCDLYDQASFDPNFPSLPLVAFEPMVQRLFMREPKAGAVG